MDGYKDVLTNKQAELTRLKAHNDYLEEKYRLELEIKKEKKRAKKHTFIGRLLG